MLSAITLDGTATGTRLLSSEAIQTIFDQQSDGIDLVLGLPLRFGIGFGLPVRESTPFIPEGQACFWGGAGGSLIVMDLERRMTFAYMMNKMDGEVRIGSPRAEAYLRAAYAALDVALPG
jgi:CubicO group peptidase (beta-lactamase class C family)